jgi:hypothetical protein
MIVVCEYCHTEVDVGDTKYGIERTMDNRTSPAKVAFVVMNGRHPRFDLPLLHYCELGIPKEIQT